METKALKTLFGLLIPLMLLLVALVMLDAKNAVVSFNNVDANGNEQGNCGIKNFDA